MATYETPDVNRLAQHAWYNTTSHVSNRFSFCSYNCQATPRTKTSCDRCDRIFTSHVGLVMHKYRGHNMQRDIFQTVVSNQCPACLRLSSNAREARLHLARFFRGPCKPTRSHEYKYSLHRPARLVCHRCPLQCFETSPQLIAHMNTNLQKLARDGDLG